MAEVLDQVRDGAAPMELEEFQRAFGEFGGVERRYAHVGGLQTRDNGDPDSLFSVNGSAIVFNRYSLDLGGFKEEIAPEAVREAIADENADYHLLWDHDTTLVLARNKNGTLNTEIGADAVDFWGRVAKTTYAADLRVLMDRGDVDECSFAFTIAPGGEEWRMEDDGTIVRRVTKIDRLWDLTICARGAYPQTHSATVRSAIAGMAKERAGLSAEVRDMTASILEIAKEGEALESDERALTPGLVAWDDEQGFNNIACDIECALAEAENERYVYWWLIDLNVRDGGSEAIVCRADCNDYSYRYYLVSGIVYDANSEPVVPEADSFQPVDMKWVAVADPDESGESMGAGAEDADEEEYSMKGWDARVAARFAEVELQLRAEAAANEDEAAELLERADKIAEKRNAPAETDKEELDEEPAGDKEELDTPAEEPEAAEEPAEVDEEIEDEVEAVEEPEAQSEQDTDESDEERKRKAALARARGRAALV